LAYAYDKVNSFVGGVMLGIFLLAMLTRTEGVISSLIGGAAGMTSVVLIANLTSCSWVWYALIGCGVTFGTGQAVARMTHAPRTARIDLLMFGGGTTAGRSVQQ
jgi:hypothetical protein